MPISKQAAQELAHAKRVPDIPSPGEGQRTAAYDAIMRPTARARVKANAILQEDVTHATLHHHPLRTAATYRALYDGEDLLAVTLYKKGANPPQTN